MSFLTKEETKKFLSNKKNLGLVLANALLFVLGLVFTIVLIVSATRPVTLKREYKFEQGNPFDYDYQSVVGTFTKNRITCEIFGGDDSVEVTLKYRVVDGELFACIVGDDDWECIGTASPYKVNLNEEWFGKKVCLKCKSAIALKVVSIVFLSVGFAGGLALTYINYSNYKKEKNIALSLSQEEE